jgi:dihydrofolate reductase
MRKLIWFNMATVDGFFAGPNAEIDWHRVDDEFNQFAIDQLKSAGGLLFGRVTYEIMASYWPTSLATANDPVVAAKMNSLLKVVFSRSLEGAGWNNTRLLRENIPGEVAQLKQERGKDLFLLGSARLAATLIQTRLIDEYRIMVNPVVLGCGQPLFQGVKERLGLRLLGTRTFHNGNVLLRYEPDTE